MACKEREKEKEKGIRRDNTNWLPILRRNKLYYLHEEKKERISVDKPLELIRFDQSN